MPSVGTAGGKPEIKIDGAKLTDAVKNRIAGWQRVKEWLVAMRMHNDKQIPRFRIFSRCTNLIRTMEKVMADPRDKEEIDYGFKDDHPLDSLRYGLMWREYPVTDPATKPKTIYDIVGMKKPKRDYV